MNLALIFDGILYFLPAERRYQCANLMAFLAVFILTMPMHYSLFNTGRPRPSEVKILVSTTRLLKIWCIIHDPCCALC